MDRKERDISLKEREWWTGGTWDVKMDGLEMFR